MLGNKDFSIKKGKQIDEKKWETLLAKSPFDQQLFSAKWLLDLVHPEWLVVLVGDYEAGFVIPLKKKLGIEYLVQPLFCQQFSILGNSDLITIEILENLFHWIEKKFFKAHFCIGFSPDFLSKKWIKKDRTNCKLRIENGFQENYASQIKRHLQQAVKHNFKITYSQSPKELIELFVQNNNRKNRYYKTMELVLLEKLISTGVKRGKMLIQELRNTKGVLLSGTVWFVGKKEAVFFFSARDSEAKEKGFFSFMIHNFIMNNLSFNSILNFEGSDNEGLKRYYLGFGAQKETYFEIKKRLSSSFTVQ